MADPLGISNSGKPSTKPPVTPVTPKRKGRRTGVLPTPDSTQRPPVRPRNSTAGNNGVVKSTTGTSRSRTRVNTPPRPRARDPELQSMLENADIEVFLPGNVEYERAVACSNLLYRFSRPTYVVRPKETSDVELIVNEAVARGLPFAIKNGGHSYIGSSFPNNGIMLDLVHMNKVVFDDVGMIMTMQGGALWGNVYRTLVDSNDGLLVNGGRCPSVGVSGFILGGGIGPFSRQYGMACDNVIEMTIVTVDGERYVVRDDDDPESEEGKLFWALCGAGGSNFGVVVEIKIKVHRLSAPVDPDHPNVKPTQVVAGRHTWFPNINRSPRGFFGLSRRADDSTGLLHTMNQFYTTDWPDRMTIDSSWFSDLEIQNGDLAVRFLAYFDGDQKEFNKLISKRILNAELSKQIQRRSLAENSTRFLHETLFAQWDEETKRSTPANSSFRVFHSFCYTKKPEEITKITAIVKEELEAFKVLFSGENSGLCQVSFIHAGAATSIPSRDNKAFRWRDTVFHTYIMVQWRDKWLERDMRGFANKFKNRLRPFSIAGKASFINFPDASIPVEDAMKAYYGNNRDKLSQVKRIWDPNNFFKYSSDEGLKVGQPITPELEQEVARNVQVEEGELSDADEVSPDMATDRMAHDRWEERLTAAYSPLLTMHGDGLDISNLLTAGFNVSDFPPS